MKWLMIVMLVALFFEITVWVCDRWDEYEFDRLSEKYELKSY